MKDFIDPMDSDHELTRSSAGCPADPQLESLANIEEYNVEQAGLYSHLLDCNDCLARWKEIKFSRWVKRVSRNQPDFLEIMENSDRLNELMGVPPDTDPSIPDPLDSSWTSISFHDPTESSDRHEWAGRQIHEYLVGDCLKWSKDKRHYQAIDIRKGEMAMIWFPPDLDGESEQHARIFFSAVENVRQIQHANCLTVCGAGTVDEAFYVVFQHRALELLGDRIRDQRYSTINRVAQQAISLTELLIAFHNFGMKHGNLDVDRLLVDMKERIVLGDMIDAQINQLLLQHSRGESLANEKMKTTEQDDIAGIGQIIEKLVSPIDQKIQDSSRRPFHETPVGDDASAMAKKLIDISRQCRKTESQTFKSLDDIRTALLRL